MVAVTGKRGLRYVAVTHVVVTISDIISHVTATAREHLLLMLMVPSRDDVTLPYAFDGHVRQRFNPNQLASQNMT